jgi:hypothetical protein
MPFKPCHASCQVLLLQRLGLRKAIALAPPSRPFGSVPGRAARFSFIVGVLQQTLSSVAQLCSQTSEKERNSCDRTIRNECVCYLSRPFGSVPGAAPQYNEFCCPQLSLLRSPTPSVQVEEFRTSKASRRVMANTMFAAALLPGKGLVAGLQPGCLNCALSRCLRE